MGIARICGQFWAHPKRIHLEQLTAGKWAKSPVGGATSAGEAVARILAWLDSLDETSGEIPDVGLMSAIAGWAHDPRLLMQALVRSGLVEEQDGNYYWHDFAALNGSAIRQRNYRRNASRNGSRNESDNEIGGSGSGSGIGVGTGSETPQTPQRGAVDAVLSHYGSLHPRARPGAKERKLISARLKEGYEVADLIRAIDGNHASAFHCGENDGRKTYHALSLIFRDSSHVQEFIELAEKGPIQPKRVGPASTFKTSPDDEAWRKRYREKYGK